MGPWVADILGDGKPQDGRLGRRCRDLDLCRPLREIWKKEERKYKTAQILFFLLYSAFIIFFVNKAIIRDTLSINRDSPSLLVRETIKLSDHISWLKIKDESHKSFPGDHATTALLFGSTFIYLGSKAMKICASIYMVFLILPRMILGAHWFSDVVVGSGSIVMFFLTWAYLSPLAHRASKALERGLNRGRRKAKLTA
jgi:membrane-associated phospholipid phosphatase